MNEGSDLPFLRIGELSKRVGVSEHLLRAWELRYDLMAPARSEGGYRLYTAADEKRVRRMLSYLADGLAAAQAAQAAKAESRAGQTSPLPEIKDLDHGYELLRESLDGFDEPVAQNILDRMFRDYPIESVLREVVLPYLKEMGARWSTKTLSVGQEHFASNIFRGRLAELAKGWGEGEGPSALLACPPGEEHEFALLIAGIMLHRNGWTIRYLGKNTPLPDIIELASQIRPAMVLISSIAPERFTSVISELRRLSTLTSLVIGGRGATQEIADQCHAKVVDGDPISAPEEIAKVLGRPI